MSTVISPRLRKSGQALVCLDPRTLHSEALDSGHSLLGGDAGNPVDTQKIALVTCGRCTQRFDGLCERVVLGGRAGAQGARIRLSAVQA